MNQFLKSTIIYFSIATAVSVALTFFASLIDGAFSKPFIDDYQTLLGSVIAVFAAVWAGSKALEAAREQILAVDRKGRTELDRRRKTLANMLVREIRNLSEVCYAWLSDDFGKQNWSDATRQEEIKFFPIPKRQETIFDKFRLDLIEMSVDGEISTTGVDWIESFYNRLERLSTTREIDKDSLISVGDFASIFIEAHFSLKYLRRLADLSTDVNEQNIRVLIENNFGVSENFNRHCIGLEPQLFVRNRWIKNYQYRDICKEFGRHMDDEVAQYGHGGLWYSNQ